MSPDSSTTGELLAVSVGLPREVPWQGEIVRTGIFKSPTQESVQVGVTGIEGDGQADLSVHGGVDKAVYAYDESSTHFWRAELGRPELSAGAFGENLTVAGWPEDRVRIGDRFQIGEVVFEVSQPRQPCFKLGMRYDDPTFPKRFIKSGRVGYYLRVLEPGRLTTGMPMTRIESNPDHLDIKSIVQIWLDRNASQESLERAANLASLAEAWRAPLQKRLDQVRSITS